MGSMAIAIAAIHPECKLGGLRSNGIERKTDFGVDIIVYIYSFATSISRSSIFSDPYHGWGIDPCQEIRALGGAV